MKIGGIIHKSSYTKAIISELSVKAFPGIGEFRKKCVCTKSSILSLFFSLFFILLLPAAKVFLFLY